MRIATSKFSPTRSTKRAERSTSSGSRVPRRIRQQRRQDDVGQVARHRHAQAAARLDLPVLRERRRRRNVLDDVMRMFKHGESEVGDGELAGGTQQSARPATQRRDPS
jgi:hypothetical protein